MRKALEDFYYGNISPGAQQMAPNSELNRAANRVARFENQLTEQLDEAGQTVLAKLIRIATRNRQHHSVGKFHSWLPAGGSDDG